MTIRHTYSGGVRKIGEKLINTDRAISNLGLVEIAKMALSHDGIDWAEVCSGVAPADTHLLDVLPVGQSVDSGVVEFVQSHREGLITYGRGVSTLRLIEQIANAFPTLRIIVVCHSSDSVHEMGRRLRSAGLPTTTVVRRQIGTDEFVQPVVVCTQFGATDGGLDFEQADIVLFPDARHALHEQAEYLMSRPDARYRLFGFLAEESRLASYDADRLTRIFDCHRVFVPKHGYVLNDVRIAFLRIFGGRFPQELELTDLKRSGLRNNHFRNRLIAKTGRHLVAGDDAAYQDLFPATPEEFRSCQPKRVVIVVEDVAHAAQICKNLRGWPVWIARNERLGPNQQPLTTAGFGMFSSEVTAKFISTVDGLASAPLQSTDVIIWAAAGTRGPEIPDSRLVTQRGQERSLLLVDCRDTQHPTLIEWSRARLRDYMDREWLPLGINRVFFRRLSFLNSRGS